MSAQCFKRCVQQPGASLSGAENECLAQCVGKFLATTDIVSRQWNKSVNEMNTLG